MRPAQAAACYPNVDLALLREILARKIVDPQVMWLADQILVGGAGVLAGECAMVYFSGGQARGASGARRREGREARRREGESLRDEFGPFSSCSQAVGGHRGAASLWLRR